MSDAPFNGLSPAQAERLALLAEECAEVIHAVAKVLRHGYANANPLDPASLDNRASLQREIAHVFAAYDMMATALDVDPDAVNDATDEKLRLLPRWMHHQHEAA